MALEGQIELKSLNTACYCYCTLPCAPCQYVVNVRKECKKGRSYCLCKQHPLNCMAKASVERTLYRLLGAQQS